MGREGQGSAKHWWEESRDTWEIVPPRRVQEIFAATWPPRLVGFTSLKSNVNVRVVDPEITHMVRLGQGKGLVYHLQWGVSLAFMPHRWTEERGWHRAGKAERPDLWQYADQLAHDEGEEHRAVLVPSGRGEATLLAQLANTWAWAEPRILQWFSIATTVDGVLHVAHTEMERISPAQEYRWPPPQLVTAFCLARSGRTDEAATLVEAYLRTHSETPQARHNLYHALSLA